MDFQKIIKGLRTENDYTQETLAPKLNVSKATIAMWETGKRLPSPEKYEEIADFFNVDIDYLYGRTNVKRRYSFSSDHNLSNITNLSTPAAYGIPVLGTICAGDGVFCEENFEGVFFVDKSIEASYCLKVKGDSMSGAEIYDGDLAFIKKTYEYEDGRIYAVVYGAEENASLKKVYKTDGQLILTPCNNLYKPMVVNPDEVFLVGECVGVYRSIDRNNIMKEDER